MVATVSYSVFYSDPIGHVLILVILLCLSNLDVSLPLWCRYCLKMNDR